MMISVNAELHQIIIQFQIGLEIVLFILRHFQCIALTKNRYDVAFLQV